MGILFRESERMAFFKKLLAHKHLTVGLQRREEEVSERCFTGTHQKIDLPAFLLLHPFMYVSDKTGVG